ncbi:MAG: FMN-binding protein [Candidatus Aureabacteria bacterium]|nr:FMN-binding protein [Candidatus Auribacterota bacterium]
MSKPEYNFFCYVFNLFPLPLIVINVIMAAWLVFNFYILFRWSRYLIMERTSRKTGMHLLGYACLFGILSKVFSCRYGMLGFHLYELIFYYLSLGFHVAAFYFLIKSSWHSLKPWLLTLGNYFFVYHFLFFPIVFWMMFTWIIPSVDFHRLNDGVYRGKSNSIANHTISEVTVKEGTLVSIRWIQKGCSEYGMEAYEQLPGRILRLQSLDVDGISGATRTSNLIKSSVGDALQNSTHHLDQSENRKD